MSDDRLSTYRTHLENLELRLTDMAKKKARHELLNRLMFSLSSVAGLDNMLEHILSILMEAIGASNISIYYRHGAVWHYRDMFGATRQMPEPDTPSISTVIESGVPLRLDNGQPPYPDQAGSTSTQAWIFPLISQGRRIGAVCMEGMQMTEEGIWQDILPFFVYASLMLDNEICNYDRLEEAHRKLQDSETLYRALFEQSPDGLILVNPSDMKPYCFNDALHQLLGYTREEFAGMAVSDYELTDTPEQIARRTAKLKETGFLSFDSKHGTKQGGVLDVHVSLRAVTISGQPLILGIVRDITEKKLAEEALKRSEHCLNEASRIAHVGHWDWDMVNDHIAWSDEVYRIFGYEPGSIIPSFELITSHILGHDRQEVADAMTTLCRQGEYSVEFPFKRSDGCLCHGHVIGCTTFDDAGTPVQMTGAIIDITERKNAEEERLKLEQQMLHSQKLESLGVLAGGIAHDFNNILTAIIGNVELAKMQLAPESPVRDNIMRIETSALRAADLSKQMLAYSGKGRFLIEPIDLNRLVEEMLHLMEVSISKKAVLRLDLHRPLPSVVADAAQIRQVLMNLVTNASEAIGDKSGVIAVSTGCYQYSNDSLLDVWSKENLPQGLYVSLEVTDTGCGMDSETIGKIFDPFFTTKFTGRGLGMAALLGIVRGHKGSIRVYSEPGKGATFKILLPAGQPPSPELSEQDPREEWHGSGTVLLVDDEETILAIGDNMLKKLGFTTITAEDGCKALELYREHREIDLVILDLTMPHMDGEQTFNELQLINPDVKVIMSSGFSESEVTQKFAGKGLAGFIQKPYTMSELRNCIKNSTTEP